LDVQYTKNRLRKDGKDALRKFFFAGHGNNRFNLRIAHKRESLAPAGSHTAPETEFVAYS
jgi:hypothetical protein